MRSYNNRSYNREWVYSKDPPYEDREERRRKLFEVWKEAKPASTQEIILAWGKKLNIPGVDKYLTELYFTLMKTFVEFLYRDGKIKFKFLGTLYFLWRPTYTQDYGSFEKLLKVPFGDTLVEGTEAMVWKPPSLRPQFSFVRAVARYNQALLKGEAKDQNKALFESVPITEKEKKEAWQDRINRVLEERASTGESTQWIIYYHNADVIDKNDYRYADRIAARNNNLIVKHKDDKDIATGIDLYKDEYLYNLDEDDWI